MRARRIRLRGAVASAIGIVAATLLLAPGSGSSAAVVEQSGNVEARFAAGLAPKALRRFGLTPGALRLSSRFATLDGSHLPALRELVWETDGEVRFDARGLPVCRPRLPTADLAPGFEGEEKMCANAIVGRGRAELGILFEESTELQVDSPLVVYNGGVRGEVTRMLARAYITKPVASAVVLEIRLEPIDSGRFRTAMAISVPKVAGGAGSVTQLSMRLKRTTVDPGRTASFVSVRCLDGVFAARASATFSDGTAVGAPVRHRCAAR
jgi:hypothetical protein